MIVNINSRVSARAVVSPPCECGKPFAYHLPAGCAFGYQPKGIVRDLGLRCYQHPDRWCMMLWHIERWVQGIREARERQTRTI